MKSLTTECPPSRVRQRGHWVHLCMGVPGIRILAFSLSKSNASVHAAINCGPKYSLYTKSGGFELCLRPSQTNLTHSRMILKPSAASGILVTSRFADDPSLCSGGCRAEYKIPSQGLHVQLEIVCISQEVLKDVLYHRPRVKPSQV